MDTMVIPAKITPALHPEVIKGGFIIIVVSSSHLAIVILSKI
jgi:hypothetical protein